MIHSLNAFNSVSKANNADSNKLLVPAYLNLKPLMQDTISFTAMKKSQFKGFDLAVINKFHIPIEKFNSQLDFQNWCSEEIDKIKEKDYPARQEEATIQRKVMLKEWFDYVTNENNAYSSSIQLLILNSITANLKKMMM